jgi:type IV secretory pathway TrbD component
VSITARFALSLVAGLLAGALIVIVHRWAAFQLAHVALQLGGGQ